MQIMLADKINKQLSNLSSTDVQIKIAKSETKQKALIFAIFCHKRNATKIEAHKLPLPRHAIFLTRHAVNNSFASLFLLLYQNWNTMLFLIMIRLKLSE